MVTNPTLHKNDRFRQKVIFSTKVHSSRMITFFEPRISDDQILFSSEMKFKSLELASRFRFWENKKIRASKKKSAFRKKSQLMPSKNRESRPTSGKLIGASDFENHFSATQNRKIFWADTTYDDSKSRA